MLLTVVRVFQKRPQTVEVELRSAGGVVGARWRWALKATRKPKRRRGSCSTVRAGVQDALTQYAGSVGAPYRLTLDRGVCSEQRGAKRLKARSLCLRGTAYAYIIRIQYP
jgi:hypothetical protein